MISNSLLRAVAVLSLILISAAAALAHDDDKKLPPTKAKADLAKARAMMDIAKKKLTAMGRYACCVKTMGSSKAPGCDLCAKTHGSCNCGANLVQGKGVCGECLSGWKSGRGAIPGTKPESVSLLDSGSQAMPGSSIKDAPPELAQAREVLNGAKRILVKETRYSCCVGQGGCDECAYEASCPCAKQMALGQKGKGVCGQCFDGQHAGIGRIGGVTFADAKLSPMDQESLVMTGLGGIPSSRESSGTSWQPDSTRMNMIHSQVNLWKVMQHYNAFLSYDNQSGPRGDDQLNAINWYMLMGTRPVGTGQLTLRGMFSLDPATVGPRGYPNLFQSGESYSGRPLVDRQHPHDFFMELAARYQAPAGGNTVLSLYVAPVGEPALGPPAFPHRESAMDIPSAPIGHHWQDGSHVTPGVVTFGAARGQWQLEGSAFTGREPDEHRWNLDPIRLDSSSVRVSWNPGSYWALQGSYGYIHSPEELHPGEDVRRTTVSALYSRPGPNGRFWSSALVWGRNRASGADSDSWLLETDLGLSARNALFGRLEYVEKTGEELNVAPAERKYGVTELTLGGIHELTPTRSYNLGVGAAVTVNWKPKDLDSLYGGSPMGYWLFLRIRPAATLMGQH